ncbi:MAG: PAS-domain containing protein [Paracoccus sp. (in: a-proteobacteria)]|nr:PAS-domain containing protein [Paracoccus sp. (in: a-proteobacteria)]
MLDQNASVIIAFAAALAAVLVALLVIGWRDRVRQVPRLVMDDMVEPCIFLFRQGKLIDATPPARRVIAGCPGSDLTGLLGWLAGRIDGLDGFLDEVEAEGFAARQGDGPLRIEARNLPDARLRVTLTTTESEQVGQVIDTLSLDAMQQELDMLRRVVDSAPMMIWHSDRHGQIGWANAAYISEAEGRFPQESRWPLPQLLQPVNDRSRPGRIRRATTGEGEAIRWFDCHEAQDDSGSTVYALPADAEVRAENSLREFLQTLTKTFADLPIGLAIFDHERHLQLFNPALISLTGLQPGFLTARPMLFTFLDQLREQRMVPEPKDYRSWRRQMASLESAATQGHHVETWSLPGGQTYRVTGRPHPGGTLAFLFEDISSEISQTRKFRADLSLVSQVLDGVGDGLILFGAAGEVLLTNDAYGRLFDGNPQQLSDAVAQWRGDWDETPAVSRLSDAIGSAADHAEGVILSAHGPLKWRMRSMQAGKSLICFTPPDGELPRRELSSTPAPTMSQARLIAGQTVS